MRAVPELRIDRSVARGLRRFNEDRLRWLDEAAALGPLVVLRMGLVKLYVVTSPDVARTILVGGGTAWVRPPAAVVPIRVGVGENLFTQRDRAWRRLQPSVAPAFRRGALQARLADVDTLIADDVASIPLDTTVDLELAMGCIALRLAAWVLLGEILDRARAEDLARHQRAVVQWVGNRLGRLSAVVPLARGRAGRAMKAHRAALMAYADDIIATARSSAVHEDALGALLTARPSNRPLRARALRSHVLGLFLAGNETTAAALSWALVNGARSPAEWARVRAEPACAAPFVEETLRLDPAVWGIPRFARRGATLTVAETTAHVRRGEGATIYLRAMNRDPRVWPDPLRFDPARDRSPGTAQHRALLPFGLGPRGCIGQHLALAEMHAVLPVLARHGDVAVAEPIVEDPNFALRVRGGLRGSFSAPVAATRPSKPT